MKRYYHASLIFVALFLLVSISSVQADLSKRGSIRGTFYQDLDGNGICGGSDTVIANFGIEFTSSDGTVTINLLSGSNGTYGLVGSGLGDWIVTAVPPSSSWRVTSTNPRAVKISPESPIALHVDFCVQGGGSAITRQATTATAPSIQTAVSGQPPSLNLEANYTVSENLLTTDRPNDGLSYEDLDFFVRDGNRDVTLPADQPDWLTYLNQFRAVEHLPSLTEAGILTQGSYNHARFMVLNDVCCGHSENPLNPLFTDSGNDSGRNGLIFSSTWDGSKMEHAINFWISAPFHLLGILDPALTEVGFGEFRQETGVFHYAAVLDVRSLEVDSAPAPDSISYPIFFPADGTETFVVRRSLPEYPDPLTAPACASFTVPTGPALVMLLGEGDQTPVVNSHQVLENGRLVDSCTFTETTYQNPNAYAQQTGRTILDTHDAVVITPRYPLIGGATYRVELVVNGEPYAWEFTAREK